MTDRQSNATHPLDREDMPGIQTGDTKWLREIKTGYRTSTDFLDDGIRTEWERALQRFHSEHPSGSKYHTKNYRHRSKVFRPKTRSMERRAGARAAKALFSSSDLVDVSAHNKGDKDLAQAARYRKALLQYRMKHSVPWLITCLGARQDTFNNGICISLQTWDYQVQEDREVVPVYREDGTPEMDDEGFELGEERVVSSKIVKDCPTIKLFAPENIRFDPNADWRNPFADSPYISIMMPMYVGEIRERMKKSNPVTGQPEWRDIDVAGIINAAGPDDAINEVIRQARQGRQRSDPMDTARYDEGTSVWVHLNIVMMEGKDYAFYSLGNHRLLSDPKPVEEVLPLGRESLTFGFSIVESHRAYPSGANQIASQLQNETNDIANQRLDNVRLALNQRYLAKRGRSTDFASLMRSTPGSVTMVDSLDDIEVMTYNDVTGSSYQEQDRLTQELDELVGNFSPSSIQANRTLNETVGGMGMLSNDANEVSDLDLLIFTTTWVEPVLQKFDKLIAMFETDKAIKAIAAGNSKTAMLYGNTDDLDHMLDHEMVVTVNVGMGNTDPAQRMNRFSLVLGTAAQIPAVAAKMDPDEIGKEVFALGGFSDSSRFFLDEDQLAKVQQSQQEPPPDPSLEVAALRSEDARYKADKDFELGMAKLALEEKIKLSDLYEKLGYDREKLKLERDKVAATEANRTREMNLRRDTGAGI